MPWVEFTADHTFTPKADRRVSTRYRTGHVISVTRECAAEACHLGRAHRVRTPTKVQAAALKANGWRRPAETA